MIWTYIIIAVLLLAAELIYFRIADKRNIIDKPNERSSHKTIVLRGGGIIFTIGLWIWSIWYGFQYPWLLAGVTLAAGISFVDDIHSLQDSLRLVVQFTAMFLVFQEIGLLHWDMWWVVPIALIAAVGGTNITICHRIMLHENLGQAHRKHAYQLMANELKMSHVIVSLIYMGLQLVVSLGFIYLIPNTIVAHWIYLVTAALVLAVAYALFKMKYYHLHEEYLRSLESSKTQN